MAIMYVECWPSQEIVFERAFLEQSGMVKAAVRTGAGGRGQPVQTHKVTVTDD
jgi:hypothetical protein